MNGLRVESPHMVGVLGGALRLAGSLGLVAGLLAAPASAATITFGGSGGVVPNNNPAGATFDINILDPSLIAASGNNVTLTLNNLVHQHMVDLHVTLEHVGFGGLQVAFSLVLDNASAVCGSTLNGNYAFNSGAATTLRSACSANGTGFPNNDTVTIPSGTYMTTLGDDVTNSGLSSFWNGQTVAGTWRLFISDSNISTDSFNGLNSTWSWQLSVETATTAVPEPATLALIGPAVVGLLLKRRRAARRVQPVDA